MAQLSPACSVSYLTISYSSSEQVQAVVPTMETRIQDIFSGIPSDVLQRVVDSIPRRLRQLVDATGTYIEI